MPERDPRESPEWGEYERLRDSYGVSCFSVGAVENGPELAPFVHERAAALNALDAFVLRLLTAREGVTLLPSTIEELSRIALIPTAGPRCALGITPYEARSILALTPVTEGRGE